MRTAVLQLYTNQIMDNLVRAYDGLPLVQLDYTTMTGTITHDAGGSVNDSQTITTNRNPILTTARNFARTTAFAFSAAQKSQLTITANPVLNNNEVYNAYLEFIVKPGRFVVTSEPPMQGQAHIVKCACAPCCDQKRYYWVPCEYRHDFLRLSLVTTVQRGQPLSVSDYFEATASRVEDDEIPGFIRIYLSKKVPNDTGRITFTLASEAYELATELNKKIVPGTSESVSPAKHYKFGDKMDYLFLKLPVSASGKIVRMQADPNKPEEAKLTVAEFKQLLQGQTLRIDLTHYKPTVSTTEDLIQAIRNEVGLIRLGTLPSPNQ